MDFNPKHDSVHIPPDPPPDLGFGSFANVTSGADITGMKGTAISSKVCVSVVEVPVAAKSGNIPLVVLAESDVVCLGRVLGDNWRSRVLKEKIVFSNSDLRFSFSADTDLEVINAGCYVNLLIEGLGKRRCPIELFSSQYGSVFDVLSYLAKCSGTSDGGNDMVMKEMSVCGTIECLDKRKKRSVRNEGLQVKASKVMWDNRSTIKVPVEGKIACKDDVLPNGACSYELVDSFAKTRCKGRFRECKE
ncbi:hypothetical protein Hanom_Chr06g00558021 [Helianthus anomalus]